MTEFTPWQWVNPNTDEPWTGETLYNASLRTIQEFGENKVEVIDGKTYTSFAFPKFILESEVIAEDKEGTAHARLIAAAPNLLAALEAQEAWEVHDCPPPFGHNCQWCFDCQQKVQAIRRAAIARARGE